MIENSDYDRDLRIIGFGNNCLIAPDAKNLAILSENFSQIKDFGDLIEIEGRVSSGRIFSYFKAHNLAGVEFLRALPGSLGGLIKMNAGMKSYEIKDILDSVLVDDRWLGLEELGLAYRKSAFEGVVFAARLKKIEGFRNEVMQACTKMRENHPREPSCGSCFKNPCGDYAGRLLEAAGLKGYSISGVGFSDKHANFLVTYDRQRADFDSAIKLIDLAKKRVFEEFGIMLECEVEIIR